MQKINFKNLPDTSTPLNASTLNQMQDNIESAIDTVASDIPTVVDSLDSDSTTNAPSVHVVKQLNTYSENETLCGYDEENNTLIPRYRKKFIGTFSGTNNLTITHGLTNFVLRKIDGVQRNPATNSSFVLPSIRPAFPDYAMGIYVTTTDIVVEVTTNAPDRTGQIAEVILEYNKTTN